MDPIDDRDFLRPYTDDEARAEWEATRAQLARRWPLLVAVILLVLGLTWFAAGQESTALGTPILAQGGITTLRPAIINLNNVAATVSAILLQWNGAAYVQDGRTVTCVYGPTTTPTGASLLVALNKANLVAQSLERRIMVQVATSCPPAFPAGIGGTVSGAPQ